MVQGAVGDGGDVVAGQQVDTKRSEHPLADERNESAANALASPLRLPAGTPSKETFLSDGITKSPSVRPSDYVKKALFPQRDVGFTSAGISYQKEAESTQEPSSGKYRHEWTNKLGKRSHVVLEQDTVDRLFSCTDLSHSSFSSYLQLYLEKKVDELDSLRFPFTIPADFYELCLEVCNVTHELFADAINVSNVLPYFCSEDPQDRMFGAEERWEAIEDVVHGGAGNPPFRSDLVERIITKSEKNVRKGRPYCRIYLLPFDVDGYLRKVAGSDCEFRGYIVAVFSPDTIGFHHQRSLLSDQLSERSLWYPTTDVALVVWVNESYRRLYPVPVDVDQCFAAWSMNNAGCDSFVDTSALWQAFPGTCRKGCEKVCLFA